MKKLLVLLSSLLIFASLFTACGNTSNTPELKTVDEEYSFLFINKANTFPTLFNDNSWYCVVSKYRDPNQLANTTEEINSIMFIYVENNNNKSYWRHGGYIDKRDFDNNSYDLVTELKDELDYWCEITPAFYNKYKNKLPNFLSSSPEFTEEEEYTKFYNKIAAHTWVCANLNSSAFSDYNEARLEKYGSGDSEDISLYLKSKNDNSIQRIGSVLNKQDTSIIKINSSEWKRITSDQTFIVKIISSNTVNIIITFDDNTVEFNFTKN